MKDQGKDKQQSIEEAKAYFGMLLESLAEYSGRGIPNELDALVNLERDTARIVLEDCGANFSVLEGEESGEVRRSLAKYSNLGRSDAMRAIWGDKFRAYKAWTEDWIGKHEDVHLNGRELPALEKSGHKNSGMIQFLGELTAFAAGEEYIGDEDFMRYISVRIHNGKVWETYPDKEERTKHEVKVLTPNSEGKEIKISSIPPSFPLAAFGYLQRK